MHILLITPQLPYPPRQGTSIRNFGLISHLAKRHTVDLLSFLAPGDESVADGPLGQLCGRIATVPQPERSVRSARPRYVPVDQTRYGAPAGVGYDAAAGAGMAGGREL